MKFLLPVVFAIMAAGCTSPLFTKNKSVTEGQGTEERKPQTISEPEPQESKDVRLTIIDTLNRGKEISLATADFQTVASNEPVTSPSPSQDQAFRFRIQVFASNQIETLRQEKKQLESKIDVPVFIAFESPYYKLYVGDFTTRSDAENCLPRLKKLGYNDSWVVRTKTLAQ